MSEELTIYLEIGQPRPYTCSAAAIAAHILRYPPEHGLGLSPVGEMMPRHRTVGISRTNFEFTRTFFKKTAVSEYPKVTLALYYQRKSA